MKKLNDETILLIIAGDVEAMEKFVHAYNSYINALATDYTKTSSGHSKRVIDEDRKSYIFLCVIEAVMKWRPGHGKHS